MQAEFDSLGLNGTFEPTSASQLNESGASPIGFMWIFKTKIKLDNSTRHKARLVIKGYEQVEGLEFDETHAPVPRIATLRLPLALAAQKHWNIDHMDVVTAFLNPKVDRNDLFMSLTDKCKAVRPLKALYGIKQAPRLWYDEINCFLLS